VQAVAARHAGRLRVIARERRGAAATLNEAVRLARGDWIAVLNSDDRYAPDRLAVMVEAVAGTGASWGFSRCRAIDADGRPIAPGRSSQADVQRRMLDHIGLHDTIGFALTAHNVATSSGTLLFSRALFDRLEGFRDFRYVHDWDFCLRATLEAEPVYVGRELYDYRLHGANTILAARDASGAEVSSLLSAFYADAAVRVDARNPFAPVAAVWGHTFALRAIEANATRFLPPGSSSGSRTSSWARGRDERRGSGARVVVVALNPHAHAMGPVLDAWADQQAAGPFEVIVVDGGARSDFGAVAAAHRKRRPATPVRTVEVATAGRAAANNAGVRASRGELIVFVADDFRPSPGLVAAHRHFHAFAPPSAVGVGASFFDEADRHDVFRRWMEDGGLGFGVAFPVAGIDWRDDYFYVGNASLRRSTFERIGPFDERYRYDLFDDFEFSLRLRAAGTADPLRPARCRLARPRVLDRGAGDRDDAARRSGPRVRVDRRGPATLGVDRRAAGRRARRRARRAPAAGRRRVDRRPQAPLEARVDGRVPARLRSGPMRYAPAARRITRTRVSSSTTSRAASTMPTMMTWWGRIATASRRIALPLRTPKKLQNTAATTSRSVADRGPEGGSAGGGGVAMAPF
jgi:glycosyltransferase involved in cell wall biosynthesis